MCCVDRLKSQPFATRQFKGYGLPHSARSRPSCCTDGLDGPCYTLETRPQSQLARKMNDPRPRKHSTDIVPRRPYLTESIITCSISPIHFFHCGCPNIFKLFYPYFSSVTQPYGWREVAKTSTVIKSTAPPVLVPPPWQESSAVSGPPSASIDQFLKCARFTWIPISSGQVLGSSN
jgi:hypothetical protein